MTASTLDGADSDIQVSPDDGENWFTAAYVEGRRWNGWARPWFSEVDAARIAAMTAAWAPAPDGVETFQYHPAEPPAARFTCHPPEGDPYPVDVLPDPARPGEYVYGVAAGNWTWEESAAGDFPPGWAAALPHDGSFRAGIVGQVAGEAVTVTFTSPDETVTVPAGRLRPLVTDGQFAAVMLAMIDADITAGQVPAGVASFKALHVHVDANEYGDAAVPFPGCTCKAGTPHDAGCLAYAIWVTAVNRVTRIVDALLRARVA